MWPLDGKGIKRWLKDDGVMAGKLSEIFFCGKCGAHTHYSSYFHEGTLKN